MKCCRLCIVFVMTAFLTFVSQGQTQKALTNADIINMTKQGFDANLLVKDIESSATDFDVSPQALIELKNDGVPQNVMEAMLAAHAKKSSAAVEAVHGTAGSMTGQSRGLRPIKWCLLKGTGRTYL